MIVRVFLNEVYITQKNKRKYFKKGTNILQDNFFEVSELPYSKHNFWRLKDPAKPLTEDNIIADEERNIAKDIELKQKEYTNSISNMLNEKARQLGFQTFYTASVYLTQGDNPLKASAEKIGVWGGNVWGKAMQVEQQVKNGDIEMPQTWEDLKVMLPQWQE